MMHAVQAVNGPTIGNHVHVRSITPNVLSMWYCSDKLFICGVHVKIITINIHLYIHVCVYFNLRLYALLMTKNYIHCTHHVD